MSTETDQPSHTPGGAAHETNQPMAIPGRLTNGSPSICQKEHLSCLHRASTPSGAATVPSPLSPHSPPQVWSPLSRFPPGHPSARLGATSANSSAASAPAPRDSCQLPAPLSQQHLRDLALRPPTGPRHCRRPHRHASPSNPWPPPSSATAATRRPTSTNTCTSDSGPPTGPSPATGLTPPRSCSKNSAGVPTNGSGRVVSIQYPTADEPNSKQTYPSGAPAAISGPLSANPALFTRQFDGIQSSAAIGPQAILRALADVNSWRTPDRAVRAVGIGVLRDTDGLRNHGSRHRPRRPYRRGSSSIRAPATCSPTN